MTIRITTTRAALALGLAMAYVGLMPATPAAADREHQQIMADLRMLQEQTQQLQALMNGLGEALKAVNSRLEDQTSLERKAFADGKVQMDAISGDIRVVREKVDETNVRLGSLSQELESLRLAIPERGIAAPPASTTSENVPPLPTGDPAAAAAAPSTTAQPPPSGISAPRLWQQSYGEYTSGNYSLAVQGFESYLKYFPKSPQAHEAQLYIGESLFLDKKDAEAVTAYDRVIANYLGSSSVPQAYFKRGQALERLGERDRARESFEVVMKEYPNSPQAGLAKQRLDSLSRPAR
jgi:tol-pal system protein YbgF